MLASENFWKLNEEIEQRFSHPVLHNGPSDAFARR
jgi:hypothetical protein